MGTRLAQLLLGFALASAGVVAEAQAGGALPAKGTNLWMTVGERRFAITLADTAAARAFAERLPLTLDMEDLNANEKHVSLTKPLPVSSLRPGTIRNGDLMLYGTNTFVVFYVTFESAYSYTRIGRVQDPASLAQALGSGSVRVKFSRE